MTSDSPPIFFANELDMEMDQFSGSYVPSSPCFDAPDECSKEDFGFMCPTVDRSYEQVDFPPDIIFSNGTSIDPWSLQGTTIYQPSSLAPESLDLDRGWGTSVSTGNTFSRQMSDSPITEFSNLGADTDVDPGQELLSSKSPSEPLTVAVGNISGSISESSRPSKRKYSQTVGAEPEVLQTGTTPKNKEKVFPAAPNPKIKPETKKSDGKPRPPLSSYSSAGSFQNTATKSHSQLRTASRKRKKNPASSGPSTSPDKEHADEEDLLTPEGRARQTHNLVEKQYRNRLNQQFESLLAVLIENVGGAGDGEEGKKAFIAGGLELDDRRLSKAEVLDIARRRIVALEREVERLKSEMRELEANMGIVRGSVATGGLVGGAVT